MKIKKIEFCNINSLAGEWTIDFESPDFANNGMFCIAGPRVPEKRRSLMRFVLAFTARLLVWVPLRVIPMR